MPHTISLIHGLVAMIACTRCSAIAIPPSPGHAPWQRTHFAVTYVFGLPRCQCSKDQSPIRDDVLEMVALSILRAEYRKEVADNQLEWRTLLFNDPDPLPDVKFYGVTKPCLVLSEAREGAVTRWKIIEPKTSHRTIKAIHGELRSAMKVFFLSATKLNRSAHRASRLR